MTIRMRKFDRGGAPLRHPEIGVVERGAGEDPREVREAHLRQARVARLEASVSGREFLSRVERIGKRW